LLTRRSLSDYFATAWLDWRLRVVLCDSLWLRKPRGICVIYKVPRVVIIIDC